MTVLQETVLQEYEKASRWLEDKGWRRIRFSPGGQSSRFVDPIYPDRSLWINDAIEVQQGRELQVSEIMGS